MQPMVLVTPLVDQKSMATLQEVKKMVADRVDKKIWMAANMWTTR